MVDQRPFSILRRLVRSLYNAVDFPLRNLFRFRRGSPELTYQPDDDLFRVLPEPERRKAEQLAAELVQGYHLEDFSRHSSREGFRKNLYYLDLLISALRRAEVDLPDPLLAADIGPSHWFYVQALWAGLTWYRAGRGRKIELHGYEPDAYRVYNDFRSRFDHALAYLADLPGVTYHPRAFQVEPERFDLITQFFPFVFVDDHLAWGLPRGMHQPQQLLEDIYESLQDGGTAVIVNQGEKEHSCQRTLIEDALGIHSLSFEFRSLMYSYEHPSWVVVFQKGEA